MRQDSLLRKAGAAAVLGTLLGVSAALGGGPPPEEYIGADGAEMVLIPAGEFLMGSTRGQAEAGMRLCRNTYDDCQMSSFTPEIPRRRIYLDAFHIDKYEVTNAHFLKAGMEPAQDFGPEFKGLKQPVVGVTWNQAKAYCEKAGKRLPTEAEWEKAARGADGRAFPWGRTPPDGKRANFCDANCDRPWRDRSVDDGHPKTAPVGSFPTGVSTYGAHDMAGNVWEWVADRYLEDAYRSAEVRNPKGPMSGEMRTMRGGGWGNHASALRTTFRLGASPSNQYPIVGFRCARDAS